MTGAADMVERIDRDGAELARLTHDSLVGAVPAPGRVRVLLFEVGTTVIEVQIDAAPSRRLLGRVKPPADVAIEMHAGEIGTDGEITAIARSDADGAFTLALPAQRSLVSLHCRLPDGTAVETARVRL
ncbi:hypothetical protein [Pseudonocardia sp. GCM10023141]|uniref:hypothetical protein n=1 Tax=Pseudonocardia sp. GCM10023141 TaxID=3252653 RepID=UPI0036146AE8